MKQAQRAFEDFYTRCRDDCMRVVLASTGDPALAALTKAGVRAEVAAGKVCVDSRYPDGSLGPVVKDMHPANAAATAGVWVIAPKAMPPGTTLNVGLFPMKGAVAGAVVNFTLVGDGATPVCTTPKPPLRR